MVEIFMNNNVDKKAETKSLFIYYYHLVFIININP